jgi:hypothetical protein
VAETVVPAGPVRVRRTIGVRLVTVPGPLRKFTPSVDHSPPTTDTGTATVISMTTIGSEIASKSGGTLSASANSNGCTEESTGSVVLLKLPLTPPIVNVDTVAFAAAAALRCFTTTD